MMAPVARAICAVFSLFAFFWEAPEAQACIDIRRFEVERIADADHIFTGRLLHYKRTSISGASLTFRVDKVIKGNVQGNVVLYWQNSNFSVPDEMQIKTPLLIAAVSGGENRPMLKDEDVAPSKPTGPGHLKLLTQPCSGAFLLDSTDVNIENVKKILRGHPVPPHDYFAIRTREQDLQYQALAARSARVKWLLTGAGMAAGAFAAFGAAYLLWKRKRVRSS